MKKGLIGILILIFLFIGTIASAQSAQNKQRAETLIQHGREYIRNGDNDSAIVEFTEAIRLNPKEPSAFFYRAGAYHNKGDIIKIDPNDIDAINSLNYAKSRLGTEQ